MSKQETKITDKMYDVLLSPVQTEKAIRSSENGTVVFRIPLTATKKDVKEAVEALFNVKVEAVNTVRTNGKTKRFRNTIGKRSDTKKAIVKLAAGNTIDFTAGV
ncbi:MAG: 50S ribosomal protein L23 [Alphaproteobacteria bacterium]|nr:50S ribosomal protein L23 [Alphaproteobacteria bacterium]